MLGLLNSKETECLIFTVMGKYVVTAVTQSVETKDNGCCRNEFSFVAVLILIVYVQLVACVCVY